MSQEIDLYVLEIKMPEISKNSKLVVNVDEALSDSLLVSHKHKSKLFQGILLDATKT